MTNRRKGREYATTAAGHAYPCECVRPLTEQDGRCVKCGHQALETPETDNQALIDVFARLIAD